MRPKPTKPTPRPSPLSANLLYLVAVLLLLTAGTALQLAHFGWGLLLTELLIGALALLWVRVQRLPWRETLRLQATSPRLLILAFVMGLGLWLFDTWLGAVTSVLFGYDVAVPPGMYPQSLPAAVLVFVALALGAPLGEELFFRGYMQRAYDRLRPFPSILLVALLFAVFHLSLVGLPPRLPIALALGYVAWRSNSLWSGVLLHAANNAGAALFLAIIGLRPDLLEAISGSVWAPGGILPALTGLLVTAVALWLFHRATRDNAPQTAQQPSTPPKTARRQLAALLPLILALLIFAGVAALEVVSGRYPELLVTEPLPLQPLPWSEQTTWTYRVVHPGRETVGSASCDLTPETEASTLSCTLHHEPFDVQIGASRWVGGDLTQRFTLRYDRADATLLSIDDKQTFGEGGFTTTANEAGGSLLLAVTAAESESTAQIPPAALIEDMWPWQLAALPFATGGRYTATLVYPQRYDSELERSVLTVTDTAVVVGGVEPLTVPAGDFLAWRVAVDNSTAWYDADPPHTLLQFDSGPIIWQYQGTEKAE